MFPFLRNLMQHEELLDFVFAGTHKLEELGAEVLVICADVSQAAPLHNAIKQVRAHWGNLHGAIHAAGMIDTSSNVRLSLMILGWFSIVSPCSRHQVFI